MVPIDHMKQEEFLKEFISYEGHYFIIIISLIYLFDVTHWNCLSTMTPRVWGHFSRSKVQFVFGKGYFRTILIFSIILNNDNFWRKKEYILYFLHIKDMRLLIWTIPIWVLRTKVLFCDSQDKNVSSVTLPSTSKGTNLL